MKQVIQDFKTGDLYVVDVPIPVVGPGYVLVRNHYSLISAGTERTTVSTAKASLLGKARQRPDLVRQVLDTLKKEGLSETLTRVRTKLGVLKELGYSSAGTVLMSMDTHGEFKPGDRVACGGSDASHAGIVSVPQNLVVKVPAGVPLEQAAFTTLGSIAMQGVRQADPKIGESICVIGLGLLGQITSQILRANGCRVFGIDTSSEMVDMGLKLGCHSARRRDDRHLDSEIDYFTAGRGFDSVIITAGAKTNDPVELATAILRKKGVMVVVGAVPMNIPRDPHFYSKELELKISCSYGPGRYDHSYEEEGHDYPYGYVRWTEKRNMGAFVELLESRAVDVGSLTTHVFDIEEAEKAYDIVTQKVRERSIGILLRYPEGEEKRILRDPGSTAKPGLPLGLGFIGAGSFAQKYLIPLAQAHGPLLALADSRGVTAKSVGEKFGFGSYSSSAAEVISRNDVNTIFIATRHNSHGDLVLESLRAGKNVYVEKPLTIRETDLAPIKEVCRLGACRLMVGFNRRFSPLGRKAKEFYRGLSEPLVVNYRVSAGFIPKDHWIQTEEGGGRILGEVCHFVDFLQYLTGGTPKTVFSDCVDNVNVRENNRDNIAITIRFENGSLGIITYLACGDKIVGKERVEIFGGGKSFIIDDFKSAEAYAGGRLRKIRESGKGHKEEVALFIESIRAGGPSPIPLESILFTTATTFRILDSLRSGLPQNIKIP